MSYWVFLLVDWDSGWTLSLAYLCLGLDFNFFILYILKKFQLSTCSWFSKPYKKSENIRIKLVCPKCNNYNQKAKSTYHKKIKDDSGHNCPHYKASITSVFSWNHHSCDYRWQCDFLCWSSVSLLTA